MISLRSRGGEPISQMKGGRIAQYSAEIFAVMMLVAAFFIDSGHDLSAMPLRGCIIAEPHRSNGPARAIQLW